MSEMLNGLPKERPYFMFVTNVVCVWDYTEICIITGNL